MVSPLKNSLLDTNHIHNRKAFAAVSGANNVSQQQDIEGSHSQQFNLRALHARSLQWAAVKAPAPSDPGPRKVKDKGVGVMSNNLRVTYIHTTTATR